MTTRNAQGNTFCGGMTMRNTYTFQAAGYSFKIWCQALRLTPR